jgi:hypothetical protein
VSATKEHELIVAMVARYVRKRGYDLVALDCSLSWLFGDSFRLPPAIVLHRPDVLGVRKEAPVVCIGEAKTRNDIRSARTRHQLKDFTEAKVGEAGMCCEVIVGIPADCQNAFGRLLSSLGVPKHRITVIPVPRPLLPKRDET